MDVQSEIEVRQEIAQLERKLKALKAIAKALARYRRECQVANEVRKLVDDFKKGD